LPVLAGKEGRKPRGEDQKNHGKKTPLFPVVRGIFCVFLWSYNFNKSRKKKEQKLEGPKAPLTKRQILTQEGWGRGA